MSWMSGLRSGDLLAITSYFFYAHFACSVHQDSCLVRIYRDLPKNILRAIKRDYRNGLYLYPVFREARMVWPVVWKRSLTRSCLDFELRFVLAQIQTINGVVARLINFGEPDPLEIVEFFLLI